MSIGVRELAILFACSDSCVPVHLAIQQAGEESKATVAGAAGGVVGGTSGGGGGGGGGSGGKVVLDKGLKAAVAGVLALVKERAKVCVRVSVCVGVREGGRERVCEGV